MEGVECFMWSAGRDTEDTRGRRGQASEKKEGQEGEEGEGGGEGSGKTRMSPKPQVEQHAPFHRAPHIQTETESHHGNQSGDPDSGDEEATISNRLSSTASLPGPLLVHPPELVSCGTILPRVQKANQNRFLKKLRKKQNKTNHLSF